MERDALRLHLPDETVGIGRIGVAGIEHDLALEGRAVLPANLRQRAIGHGDQHHRTEGSSFCHRPRHGAGPKIACQALEVIRMPRREEHLMAGLHPLPSHRATEPARSDDADMHGPSPLS